MWRVTTYNPARKHNFADVMSRLAPEVSDHSTLNEVTSCFALGYDLDTPIYFSMT